MLKTTIAVWLTFLMVVIGIWTFFQDHGEKADALSRPSEEGHGLAALVVRGEAHAVQILPGAGDGTHRVRVITGTNATFQHDVRIDGDLIDAILYANEAHGTNATIGRQSLSRVLLQWLPSVVLGVLFWGGVWYVVRRRARDQAKTSSPGA